MQTKKKGVNRINLRLIPYAFGALALAICGFILYNLVFMVNVVVMTIALYVASSIVVWENLRNS